MLLTSLLTNPVVEVLLLCEWLDSVCNTSIQLSLEKASCAIEILIVRELNDWYYFPKFQPINTQAAMANLGQ